MYLCVCYVPPRVTISPMKAGLCFDHRCGPSICNNALYTVGIFQIFVVQMNSSFVELLLTLSIVLSTIKTSEKLFNR